MGTILLLSHAVRPKELYLMAAEKLRLTPRHSLSTVAAMFYAVQLSLIRLNTLASLEEGTVNLLCDFFAS